jgi:hypothetical protein
MINDKSMLNIVSKLFLLGIFILMPASLALADGWWGKYDKPFAWILQNGGTIIHWQIEDISKEADNWKAVMYDSKGKYVEVEYGQRGTFDDAKNGTYVVKAYKGLRDYETYKGGDVFASINVTAHPRETINIKFNYKNKAAKMATNYVKPVAKPVLDCPPEPMIENQAKEEADDRKCLSTPEYFFKEVMMIGKDEKSIIELVREAADYSNVLSSEPEIIQVIIEKEDNKNIFKKAWSTIVEIFTFNKKSQNQLI